MKVLAFYSPEEVIIAYNEGRIDLHAWIKVKVNVREEETLVNKLTETTVGTSIIQSSCSKRSWFY